MSTQGEIAQQAVNRTGPVTGLNQRQKAAIIVRFLLNEGAALSLSDLPDHLQTDLTQMMGSMRYVDRDTLAAVIMEFAGELESVGLAFPEGLGGALSALEGQLSPHTAARLRKEAGVRQAGDPWDRIRALPIETLLELTDTESTEISAVLLAKLDVAKAAELLGAMPGEKARRISYAVSLTKGITPDAADRIGLTIASQLDDIPPRAFAEEPEERIGAILNFSRATTREDVLTGLNETDTGFAAAVRRSIFTFADIPGRLVRTDVPAVLREVDQADLVRALAFATSGADGEASNFLLSNMSSRLANQLREEVEEVGQITAKDGDAALTAVVVAIRSLADQGQIRLIPPDEVETE